MDQRGKLEKFAGLAAHNSTAAYHSQVAFLGVCAIHAFTGGAGGACSPRGRKSGPNAPSVRILVTIYYRGCKKWTFEFFFKNAPPVDLWRNAYMVCAMVLCHLQVFAPTRK